VDDESWNQLRATIDICPEQAGWPEPKYSHQIALHDAATEARQALGKLDATIAKIEGDSDLTASGKRNARAKAATQALVEIEKLQALEKARSAVAYQLSRWDEKFGVDKIVRPAADAHEAMVYSKIIDRVAGMDAKDRLSFFTTHASDPAIASAVLLVPSFISGLGESELGVIRAQIEKNVVPTEVREEKAATSKMLSAVERGWTRLRALASERGGLRPEQPTIAKSKTEAAA